MEAKTTSSLDEPFDVAVGQVEETSPMKDAASPTQLEDAWTTDSDGFNEERYLAAFPDIAEAVTVLEAAGIELKRYPGVDQDERGVWTAPGGAKVAWFEDPEGNILSVSQHT